MGSNCTCQLNTQQPKPQQQIINTTTELAINSESLNAQPPSDKELQSTHTSSIQEIQIEQLNKQALNLRKKITQNDRNSRKMMLEVMCNEKKMEDSVVFDHRKMSKQDKQIVMTAFKKNFILSQLNQSELQKIAVNMRFCTAEENTYIFKKGDPSFSYYIILNGLCQVNLDHRKVKFLRKGDAFGELGIIYNAPRSASVLCKQKTQLIQLNKQVFTETLTEINQFQGYDNHKLLNQFQFYNSLHIKQQKQLLNNCVCEVYEVGQTIYSKGDHANAMYIIKQGIATILQKKIDLKKGQHAGQNTVFSNDITPQFNTLIAKTNCKIISIKKTILLQTLGQSLINLMKKNLILKIIKKSDINQLFTDGMWSRILVSVKYRKFIKGQTVFRQKQTINKEQLYIVLGSDIYSSDRLQRILGDTIVGLIAAYRGDSYTFDIDFIAENDGYVAILQTDISKRQLQSSVKFSLGINQQKKNELSLITVDSLYIVGKIGNSNISEYYSAYNPKTKNKYFLKVIKKKFINDSTMMNYMMKEQQILQQLPVNPYIVHFYKIIEIPQSYIFVLQLIEGVNFLDAITSKYNFNETHIKFFIVQIVQMIEHLHKHKIIYRNLTLENLMLNYDNYLKLFNMNTGKKLNKQSNYRTSTVIGIPHYNAPEMIFTHSYSFQVDFWSMGVLFYQLLTGHLPFGHDTDDPVQVYQQILTKSVIFPRKLQNTELKNLIKILLDKVPSKRFGGDFQELKASPYLLQVKWSQVLEQKLFQNYSPPVKNRISLYQIERCLNKNFQLNTYFNEK